MVAVHISHVWYGLASIQSKHNKSPHEMQIETAFFASGSGTEPSHCRQVAPYLCIVWVIASAQLIQTDGGLGGDCVDAAHESQ